MKHRPLLQLALMASLATAISGPVFAQDFVEPAGVRTSPQRYWAKEIAFQDRLIELPSGKTQVINDRPYYTFRIAELGAGYADQATYEKLKGLRLEQEYLFTGTVLERRGKYYVVVRSVDSLFKEPNKIEEEIKKDLTRTPEELKRHRKRQLMVDLMNQAQASMLLRSRQDRFDFKEYFNPDSPESDAMQQMIQNVVAAMEREGRMSASDLLSVYIRDALSDHYMGTTGGVQDILIPEAMLKEINAIAPPPEPAPAGATTPPPATEPAAPPEPAPLPIAISTNEAPMVVEGNLPVISPEKVNKLVPPTPSTPGAIIGNEPDEVLERLLNDAGGPASVPEGAPPAPEPPVVVPAPEPTPEVVPAPEPAPPVVTPEPEPPVVTPAPVEPAPAPEPTPEVVVPAPEPAPPIVTPEPEPPVVTPAPVEPAPAPEPTPEVVPAPEPVPPVVTPEPEPPVVTPAPVEPAPAPEPTPEVVPAPEPVPPVVTPEPEPPVVTPAPVEPAPAPEPTPEVVPAPEPAPPVVTPEPEPPVVTPAPVEPAPAPEPTPEVVPAPEPAPPVVTPEPEPPVVTPAPVEPAPAPEPTPEVVVPAPEPTPPVVTPEPAPSPVTTIPEPVPAEKVTPPAEPVKPVDPPPRKRGLLSRLFGGGDEPAPPKAEKPTPTPPRIPDEDRVPKPPRKPEPTEANTPPPAKKPPVDATKPAGKTPPAPAPAPASPDDEGVYDPAVDFHFKNLPKLPK